MSRAFDGNSNIVLTGFMATGKTVVGRRLAERLGYAFVDLDSLIEEEAGKTIPQIFAEKGEPAFRELEARVVGRAALRTQSVIATGGGAVVDPRNMEALKRRGFVIALRADPETILRRVGGGKDRPMLAGDEPDRRIRDLLSLREEAYARAHISVDTSKRSVEEVVECILGLLFRPPGPTDVES